MKKRRIIIITAAVILALSMGWAQENNNKKSKPIEIELADEAAVIIGGFRITLSDAIKKAIESNQDILSGKYDVAMSDTYYQKFLSKYGINFNASGGVTSSEYPELMWSKTGKESKSLDISASLSKTFSTGTTITGGVKNSYSDTLYNTIIYMTNGTHTGVIPISTDSRMKTYNPTAFIILEQELLKNAFGYNDRKLEKILSNTSKMQKDQIIYGLSLVVVGVIVDYWNVIITKTQLDNSTMMLQETRNVRRIVANNVNLGLAEQYELNYWNSMIASSEAAEAQSEQQYRDALRKFLQTVNMPDEITMQERAILQNKLPAINSEEAIKKAYSKRADYLGAQSALENAKLQLDIDGNSTLPSVKGSISVSSIDYNESMGDSVKNSSTLKYPTYSAQIRMSYPLTNSEQAVNERNSRWKVEQAKYQLDKYGRIVKDDVTSKIEKINTNHTLYQKAREARIQAQMYYEKMLTNLRRGRVTAAVVRNSLDALINSRQQELRVLVLFNASLLEFEVAKNELFETYKIDVDKYIPKE